MAAPNMSLAGKVALVTGGSRGIGKAISLKLASQGADVIINFLRRRSVAEATANEIRAKGVKVHLVKANVGEPEEIDRMFQEIEREFGRLDIFINNAASGVAKAALELDTRGWDWTMDINARAFLLCTQRAVKLMSKGGKVIAISSLGARLVWPAYSAVGVSKAALEALTRYLAIECAPLGITVNCVAPGAVESEALKLYAGDENLNKSVWQKTPAGRMVSPEDIANLVCFLCSEQASMIVGQVIVIDGGVTLAPINF